MTVRRILAAAALPAALLLPAAVVPVALAAPAAASSTANEVVYTQHDLQAHTYAVLLRDLGTGATRAVLPASTTYQYDAPKLSPHGNRIVLTSNNTGSGTPATTAGLTLVDRSGSTVTRLTTPPQASGSTTLDVNPGWSPDGSTIVFSRVTVNTSTQATTSALYTVPSTGGTPAAVPNATGGYTGSFDPTGTQLVYADSTNSLDGTGPLYVINVDGTGQRALNVTGGLPAWSPDGSTIAYATVTQKDPSSLAEDVVQLATVPAAGGSQTVFGVTRPTSARTVAEYPSWAPDGQSLIFDLYGYNSDGTAAPGDLWAVDRAGVRAGLLVGGPADQAQGHWQGPVPAPVVAGTPSLFTPTSPARILDTRSGLGHAGAVGAGQAILLPVTGPLPTAGGGTVTVPADATAVVLNVTVTGGTAATDVRVYPSTAASVPTVSNLNAGPGATVPNLVTATVGSDGRIALRNAAGSAQLIADLAGWYTPSGSTSSSGAVGFAPVSPARVLDTRIGLGAPRAPVAGGTPLDLPVTGTLPTASGGTVAIPDSASAVVLNLTATSATQATDVRAYPAAASSVPTVSNLNLDQGQTTPNLVTVSVSRGGDGHGHIRLLNHNGTVELIADVAGYYSGASAGRYVPVAPVRFLDTRPGIGAAPIPVPAGGFVDLQVAGSRGVPATITGALLNVTGTSVTASTDVRAFPMPASGTATPTVSNLNLVRDETRANLAVVVPGADGRVRLRNAAGGLQLVGDLAGYFLG